MNTSQRLVMVACAALLFLQVVMKSRTGRDVSAHTAFRASATESITVKVSGDVIHPGIYEVPVNSLASAVIDLAEPVRPLKQRFSDLPASHFLKDGSDLVVLVPSDGTLQLQVGQMTVAERMVLGIPLEISMMSEADFERLPGIGPTLARRIIEYRQNNDGILRVGDLVKVEGIGENTYRRIRKYLQHP